VVRIPGAEQLRDADRGELGVAFGSVLFLLVVPIVEVKLSGSPSTGTQAPRSRLDPAHSGHLCRPPQTLGAPFHQSQPTSSENKNGGENFRINARLALALLGDERIMLGQLLTNPMFLRRHLIPYAGGGGIRCTTHLSSSFSSTFPSRVLESSAFLQLVFRLLVLPHSLLGFNCAFVHPANSL